MDERTTEIVRLFQQSWIETRTIYEGPLISSKMAKPFISFINDMIKKGEDRHLRAGFFLLHYSLSLSRSVHNRLRPDQKFILLEYWDDGTFQASLRDGNKIYRDYRLPTLNDERLNKLIDTLKHTLVD